MHGGISQRLTNFDQLRQLKRPSAEPFDPLVDDLLWADPDANPEGKGYKSSPRKVSFTFGADVVEQFCKTMSIDLIARAHQVIQEGYRFCSNRRCVTVFSAPNYCGTILLFVCDCVDGNFSALGVAGNNGAAMIVSKNMRVSFQIFRPRQDS
jgi:hypothetical protein